MLRFLPGHFAREGNDLGIRQPWFGVDV